MAMACLHRSHRDYNLGIICALAIERAAVESMLDEEHTKLSRIPGDDNDYTYGSIAKHNVVITSLPAGIIGKAAAAAVARDMMRSFTIHASLLVGIAGGVPREKRDIRLGDVVVSQPNGPHGGVVQWDMGKIEAGGYFKRTGSLATPPKVLLTALQRLQTQRLRGSCDLERWLQQAGKHTPSMLVHCHYPGLENDTLYRAGYEHVGRASCTDCSQQETVERPPRSTTSPVVHYGTIASGDCVIKDHSTRDRIAKEEDILCFEMEAAGLMDVLPCIVIRGICDYADSHKNKSWQHYAAMTAAAYAKELLQVLEPLRTDLARSPYAIPFEVSDVNKAQRLFGREPLLDEIRTAFQDDGQRIVVVHGLGGMGKTQLALEYAYRHRQEYSAVFWLNAKDKDTIRASFRCMAERIIQYAQDTKGVRTAAAVAADDIVECVKRWLSLSENSRWLLVCDNFDNPLCSLPKTATDQTGAIDHRYFLPSAYHGAVLMTSRSSQLVLGSMIAIRKLQELRAGLDILADFSKRPDVHNDIDAQRLARELDGLPLALVTAGSYLSQSQMTFATYLEHYKQSWSKLHGLHNNTLLFERSLASTLMISFEQVQRQSSAAANLLTWWAYFDPQDMWFELLQAPRRACTTPQCQLCAAPQWLRDLLSDELHFEAAMHTLCDYGFASARSVNPSDCTASRGYGMHQCVHSWANAVLSAKWNDELALLAVECTVSCYESQDNGRRRQQIARRTLCHAASQLHYTKRDAMRSARAWHAAYKLGSYFCKSGRITDAAGLLEATLSVAERIMGEDDTRTVQMRDSVAWLCVTAVHERARRLVQINLDWLAARNQRDDRIYISSLRLMARLDFNSGSHEVAETKFLHLISLLEAKPMGNEEELISVLRDQAAAMFIQGRLLQGMDVLKRALDLAGKAFGVDDFRTLVVMYDLAVASASIDESEEHDILLNDLSQLARKTLGDDHALTLQFVVLKSQGSYKLGNHEEALSLCRKATEKLHDALGPADFCVIESKHTLANMMLRQHQYEDAETMLREVRETLQQTTAVGGTDDVYMISSCRRLLAQVLTACGRLAEAEEECRLAYVACKLKIRDRDILPLQELMIRESCSLAELANVRDSDLRRKCSRPVSSAALVFFGVSAQLLGLLQKSGKPGEWKEILDFWNLTQTSIDSEQDHCSPSTSLIEQSGQHLADPSWKEVSAATVN